MSEYEFTHDVFLSYSSRDAGAVHRIAQRLTGDGLRVWFDIWEIHPGDSIPAKIEEGLERSRTLILFMSANAFGSDWARLESGTFRFRDPLNTLRRFIPVRLDDAPLRGSLAQFRFVDWRRDENEAYALLLNACRPSPHRGTMFPQGELYTRAVTERNAGLTQLILDDSGSMTMHVIAGETRYQWLEHCVARILTELLVRSTHLTNGGPVVLRNHYLDIIRYGSSVEPWSLEELDIGEVAKRFDAAHGTFGLAARLGGTDHASAFRIACERMRGMIAKNRFRDSFPPLVLHITDGESQTDAEMFARELAELASSNGNVLITNVYVGSHTALRYSTAEDFPGYVTADDVGNNEDNLRLFRMSSVVPEAVRHRFVASGVLPSIRPGARMFFTGDMAATAMHAITLAYPSA